MLASLSIQNIVLIEQLNIEFQQGLCALTGETGAGKSILLDSLGLALGARSESGLVRKGAEQASVTAVFDIEDNHPALSILKDSNIKTEDSLILRRSLNQDGRSKAYINDQPVSAGLLREVGDMLVEIHGQFETHGLLNPATHRRILDEYARLDHKLPVLWESWKVAEAELEDLKASAEKSRAEEDYLRQAVEDLDALAPEPGEEEKLSSLRERLMHREQVLEGLNAAYHALSAENDPVSAALVSLERIADKLGEDDAKEAIATLERASAEAQEAMSLIRSLSGSLEENEHSLETIDDRLFGLKTSGTKA